MSGIELEPWLIHSGEGMQATVASWRMANSQNEAIALFSTKAKAVEYANEHCGGEPHIVQLNEATLIRLLIDGYRQGTRYAALDPNAQSARQVFVLRDVLAGAKQFLQQSKFE